MIAKVGNEICLILALLTALEIAELYSSVQMMRDDGGHFSFFSSVLSTAEGWMLNVSPTIYYTQFEARKEKEEDLNSVLQWRIAFPPVSRRWGFEFPHGARVLIASKHRYEIQC